MGNLKEVSNNSSISLSTRITLLALLVLIQTAIVLIGRYSRISAPSYELYNLTHLIMVTEATKFFLNITLECLKGEGLKGFTNSFQEPFDTLKLIVPAILYFIQNSLNYVALENLSAPIFQVTYQSKLLFTALFSVVALKHHYTLRQWFCLVSLCAGIAIVALGEYDLIIDKEQNFFFGLISVFISGSCSAFAGVYFEMIAKESHNEVTLYMRNVQLALFSLIIAAIQRSSAESKSFFHGFTVGTWFLVILQASGGLVTSFVLKFLDSVIKGLATGFSVLLSSFFSILFFQANLTIEFIAGSALIIGGTFYFHNHTQRRTRGSPSRVRAFLILFLFICFVAMSTTLLDFSTNRQYISGKARKHKAGSKGCAVVFSSGSLLKYKDGETIDSFETVIRINMARTIGFEMFVGNRTTIRVCHLYKGESGISPAQWFSDRNESGVEGITLNLTHEENAGWHNEWNQLKDRTASKWTMTERSLEDVCKMNVGYKGGGWCSSGTMIAIWAMKRCKNVTIFGMDHDPCYPYHYGMGIPTFLNCTKKVEYSTFPHDFILEEKYLKELHRNGNLTVNRFVE